jgi:hypothetical protein
MGRQRVLVGSGNGFIGCNRRRRLLAKQANSRPDRDKRNHAGTG